MTRRRVDGADVTDDELALARRYPMLVAWSPDDGVFVATFSDVAGMKAYGSSAGAAAQVGEEVIILWVTSMLDAGRFLPNSSAFPLSASSSAVKARNP